MAKYKKSKSYSTGRKGLKKNWGTSKRMKSDLKKSKRRCK